jgi:phosphohistidine phosphatase
MAEIAAGVAALGVELDEILTSPFVRTRQTADILARAWNPPPRVTDLPALATDGRPADVVAALAKRSARRRVALVGHMPGIGELAASLIGLPEALDFKKGAVCCIEIDALPPRRPGRLQWFATPRMLRRIARA